MNQKVKTTTENYLEAILMLQNEQGYVRSVDIAHKLDVTKPSVSYATHRLREADYITMDENGMIKLTPSGNKIASSIYERHRVLSAVFEELGVPSDIAREDACRVEHDISDVTFDAIKKHVGKQTN